MANLITPTQSVDLHVFQISFIQEQNGGIDAAFLHKCESMLEKSLDLILSQMVGGQRELKTKTSRATLVCGKTFIAEFDNSKWCINSLYLTSTFRFTLISFTLHRVS